MIFYSFIKSSTSWRVRLALQLKGIHVQNKHIDLTKGQHLTPEYLKINPNHGVPALQLPNGKILTESLPICLYLQETYSKYPLLPKDLQKKCHILSLCEIINSGIHPYHNLRVLKWFQKQIEKKSQDFFKKWTQHWMREGFSTLQQLLSRNKGRYCFGEEITLADVFLFPMMYGSAIRFQVAWNKYQRLREIGENLLKNEVFEKSRPQNIIK